MIIMMRSYTGLSEVSSYNQTLLKANLINMSIKTVMRMRMRMMMMVMTMIRGQMEKSSICLMQMILQRGSTISQHLYQSKPPAMHFSPSFTLYTLHWTTFIPIQPTNQLCTELYTAQDTFHCALRFERHFALELFTELCRMEDTAKLSWFLQRILHFVQPWILVQWFSAQLR